MADVLKVTILADGSLKIDTGKVSMPNHANAEAFLLDLARGCGGDTERKKKPGSFGHSHVHDGVLHSH